MTVIDCSSKELWTNTRTIAVLPGGDVLINKRGAGGRKQIELVAPHSLAFFPKLNLFQTDPWGLSPVAFGPIHF